jgi:hypothetical protein
VHHVRGGRLRVLRPLAGLWRAASSAATVTSLGLLASRAVELHLLPLLVRS